MGDDNDHVDNGCHLPAGKGELAMTSFPVRRLGPRPSGPEGMSQEVDRISEREKVSYPAEPSRVYKSENYPCRINNSSSSSSAT